MDTVSVDFLLKNDQNQWQHTMILHDSGFAMCLGSLPALREIGIPASTASVGVVAQRHFS